MKKLLITGARGFIGRHCLQLLLERKDFEIHAVSRKEQKKDRLDVHWHKADLLDSSQVPQLLARVQPSHLLHFAWYAEPGKFWNSIENFRWVRASLSLLQAFSVYGGKRVVAAGSCSEYVWKNGYCSEESTPLLPSTPYGICKHSLQMMMASFSKQADISCAWGRIFFLYGPHEHPNRLVSSVILSLLKDSPANCSHGKQIRDYLYVQDVAEAFLALLQSEVQGPVNIASGRPIAIKEVIIKIAEKLNRKDLIRLGALSASPDEPDLLVGDIGRLSKEVGWRPKYSIDQGLTKSISWWKSRSNDTQ
jgi:nucleoside-diphosphate-sugar epimerase